MKIVLRIFAALLIMTGCGTGVYFWFQQYQEPVVRAEISEHLFTVRSSSASRALSEGKKVVEYGPLPGMAFYAGALAFKQPEEALVWLKSTGKYEEGWRVFELSGDFSLDTHLVRGLPHTNKTLLVCREVPVQP